jgi:protein-disulfide isomerase
VLVLALVPRTSPPTPIETSTPPATENPPDPLYLTNYVSANPQVKPGAIIVEIHDDYQCPWCQRAEQIYGAALRELSQAGEIDLRIHIRTLVGDQIINNDSSRRAAIAATCADTVGYFPAYHSTVFENQPQEGIGYTDDQLSKDFASQAGMTGQSLTAFQTCYKNSATAAFVQAMEDEGAAAGIRGTPTFYVNGIQMSFNLQGDSATPTPISAADMLAGLKEITGG